MRKTLKVSAIGLTVLFVSIQFVRPEKNLSGPATPGPNDILTLHPPPPAVHRILTTTCYDCHSNRTRYPWYAEIQPAAWWLAHHIADARTTLNFSEFARLSPKRARSKLNACIDEVEEHSMPLPSYTWAHRDARLSDTDIKAFVAWAGTVIERIEKPDERP